MASGKYGPEALLARDTSTGVASVLVGATVQVISPTTGVTGSVDASGNLTLTGRPGPAKYRITPSGGVQGPEISVELLPVGSGIERRVNSQPLRFRGVGRGVGAVNQPGYKVYGVNLGHGIPAVGSPTGSGGAAKRFWTDTWNPTRNRTNLDRIAALGCNTVRIQGNYSAYLLDKPLYKSRVVETFEYCREIGLRVQYCLLETYSEDTGNIASDKRVGYQAYIADIIVPYAGDPMIHAWDIGNEIQPTGDKLTVIANMYTDLKAADTVTKVTSSMVGPTVASGLTLTNVQAVEPYVDFHELHIYANPVNDSFWPNWFDDIRNVTSKPFQIGEFGANNTDVDSAAPNLIPDPNQSAHYYRAFRRFAADSDCMGFIAWAIEDDGDTYKYGFYDLAGNPRPALAEWAAFPSQNIDAAQSVVSYRQEPVAFDDFGRANGVPGTSLLGQVWTVSGAWVIDGQTLAQASTSTGVNLAIIDSRTFSPCVDLDVIPNASYHFGVIARYTDASNYVRAVLRSTGTKIGVLEFVSVAGGVETVRATIPFYLYTAGRLRLLLRNNRAYVYVHDRLYLVDTAVPASTGTPTTVGIYGQRVSTTSGDQGTRVIRFASSVALRLY